jgi:hypothetical protein
MSDAQFLTAIAVASALNTLAVVVGVLINISRLRDLQAHVDALFAHVDRCFDKVCDVRGTLGPRPT